VTKQSQIALVNGEALTEHDVYDAVDNVIVELYKTGDIGKATQVLNVLDRIGNISSHAKAKLLYGMSMWWQETKQEDSFLDYIESMSNQNKATVVGRYINVQQQIEEGYIPKELSERPMRDLIPIANAIAQGYELDAKTTKRLLTASSSEIGAILRTVKGKAPRKSSMRIYLERDGSLNVWKDNKKSFVGYLDVKSEDSLVMKAIERILTATGVQRK